MARAAAEPGATPRFPSAFQNRRTCARPPPLTSLSSPRPAPPRPAAAAAMAGSSAARTHDASPQLTADEIVLLARSSSGRLPPAHSHAALLSLLLSPSPSAPLPLYVSSLLTLVSRTPRSPSLSSFLSSLLLSFLRLFRSRQIPRDGDTSRLFHLFSLHLPSLDTAQLCSVLDLVISDIAEAADPEDALPLDLLPRCLDLAVAAGSDGTAAVSAALGKILDAEWPKAVLVKVVSFLREFPLPTRARAPELLEKVFSGLKEVDVQDLPSVSYQLLLLASKGFNRRAVIGGILSFFGSGTVKGAAAIVRQVEGTVLMHFNFAVKQDPLLGQEVLRILRINTGVFNHFAAAVLLSIARVKRLGESSISLLRSMVVTSYRDCRFARDCRWLPICVSEECFRTAKCIEKSLIRAINDNCGREYIVPSSVQFGFVLLESVDGDSCGWPGISGELMGVEELGIQTLKTIFEIHDMARNEIIEQCKIRILSLKPQESSSIIKLLHTLIQSYPYAMLEQSGRLKELLDYFTFMHEKPAGALIAAILPLIKFSHDLQGYTILVVRKAMFSREDAVRLAATSAIVNLILADARCKQNTSQASCGQQVDAPCNTGASLFQELNGLLKRCLSQQAKIKEVIYWGLVKFILLDPLVAGAVLDFLWPHFLQFYREDATFLLEVDFCIKEEHDKASLGEPLDCLLSCVSWILLLQPHNNHDLSENSWACFGFSISQDNESGRTSSGECFSNALKKIRQALTHDNLKGMLGLSNETIPPPQGEMRNCYVRILSGIIEVFVNLAAIELEKVENAEKTDLQEEIVNLAVLYNSLEKDLGTKQVDGSRRGPAKTFPLEVPNRGDKSLHDYPMKTILSTSSIHTLLRTTAKLYGACISNNQAVCQKNSKSSAGKTVKHCLQLVSFVVKSCLNRLKSIPLLENDDTLKTLIGGDIKLLGPPLLQLIQLLKLGTQFEGNKRKEAKGVKGAENKQNPLYLSLMCLNELFKICLHKAYFVEFIEDLLTMASLEWDSEMAVDTCQEINQDQDLNSDMQEARNVNRLLNKWLKPLYSELLKSSFFQEAEILSNMVLMIGNRLPCKSRDTHGVWAVNICRSTIVKHPRSACSIATVAVHLRLPPNDLIITQEMALELLNVLGSKDKDPMEKSETYPIINHLTGSTIASSFLQLAESVISDLDWTVSKLKASSISNHQISDSSQMHLLGEKTPILLLEEALYSRSEALVYVLSHFAKMNLNDSQADQLLKLAAKFYKLLARTAKHQIAPKGCKQLLPGHKFQTLAEVTSKRLTVPLYRFVVLMQRSQQGNAQSRKLISRIKRENKWIPDLIFQIEDYEKYLIQLSRLTKVNLLRHAKRSTARDFKILDTRKISSEGDAPKDYSQAAPSSSQSEGSEESEDDGEKELPYKIHFLSAEVGDSDSAEVSDTDAEDQVVVRLRTKRAKMGRVVQDSDEEEA